jgi:hypothetical protein
MLVVGVGVVIFIIVGIAVGLAPSVMGAVGGGVIGGGYVSIRLWRQREIQLDLGAVASEVIVDEKSRRIAVLTAIDRKAGWIVLQVKGDFSTAAGAVRDIMGAKCRNGTITRVSKVFVVVILTSILLFVAAFGFFVLQGTVFVPAPK